MPKRNIAIITALTGKRNTLSDPTIIHENVDYYAFVEHSQSVTVWKQRSAIDFSTDEQFRSRRNAKPYKIMPSLFLPGYDYYMWVDATHDIVADPETICSTFLDKYTIAVFAHPQRTCIYKEAECILKNRLDHPHLVKSQMKYYKSMGYGPNLGLYELPVIVRRATPRMTQFDLRWWEHICRFSSRDQLSFPYLLWNEKLVPAILPGYASGLHPSTGKVGLNDLIPQVRRHDR